MEFRVVRYYCAYCNRNVTNPRQAYKLVVQVFNKNEFMNCVVFNTDATKLLGCTVDELIARDSQESAGDPDWIIEFFMNSLCGLSVVFGIKIDKYNLEPEFSRRFTVSKYYGPKLEVLNNVNCTMARVVPPLLPVVADPPYPLDSDILEYDLQSKVTEYEETMMDEIQWGPRGTSTIINDAPTMDSKGTNEEPLNNIDEDNMITDADYSTVEATMEDEDKIITDADDSMFEATIEDIKVGGSKGMLESA